MPHTGPMRRFASIEARIFVVLLFLLIGPSARADFTVGGTIQDTSGYNYAPSVIADGDFQYFWWCGQGPWNDYYKVYEDVIYYERYQYSTGTWSAINTVLQPTQYAWDGVFTCDPTVVKGNFNAPGLGGPYSYVMYYGATDQSDGTDGRIGVAFSNDGITWTKYWGNPIIYPQQYPTSTYGAGQPSAYNSNGIITLFHTDTSTSFGQMEWLRTSTDGITFSSPTLVSNSNVDGLGAPVNAGADFGYDSSTGTWFAAVPGAARQGSSINYTFDIERTTNVTAGSWQQLGTISTSLTGRELNHNPGFSRDPYGNISSGAIQVFFGTGYSGFLSPWQIMWVQWNAQPTTVPFNRYWQSGVGHWVTTGWVPYGYNLEETMGYLFMGYGSGTVAVYGCIVPGSNDQFVSPDPNCEGQYIYGLDGWIYDPNQQPPSGTQALYRCYTGIDHFVSTDPGCEGQVTEFLLGYAQTQP